MITKKTFGKQRVKQKRFKSVGDNELNVSDKNFIKNNADKFTIQQIAIRVGKTSDLVEKFMKKNKISVLKADSEAEIEKIEEPESDDEEIKKNVLKEKKKPLLGEVLKFDSEEITAKINSSDSLKIVAKYLDETEDGKKRVENYAKNQNKTLIIKGIAKDLNVSKHIVMRHFKILGLMPIIERGKTYDPSVIEFLRNNYRTMTARDMSEALGSLTFQEVVNACIKYDFIRTAEETKAIKLNWRKTIFDENEVKFVKENHGVIPIRKIAEKLNKTSNFISKIIKEHGFTITKEQIAKLNVREKKGEIEKIDEKTTKKETITTKKPQIFKEIQKELISEEKHIILEENIISQPKIDDFWVFDFDKKKKKKKKK